jgi:oxygen-dependent protoporphyrinogen oxidase
VSAPHVAIVGGGIAGLAAAWRVCRDDPSARVTLLEAAPRLGGVIHTVREDGFVMEEGPDLFMGAKPGGWELAQSLGIAHRLHGTRKHASALLFTRGELRRLPEGLTGLVPTKVMPFALTPLLSPLGKLRVALDYAIPPRRDDADETVRSLVVRRLGHEMYERIVEPLLSGIFAGDGARLSVLATFPQMRAAEREHGGMARAMLAGKRRARRAAAPERTGRAERPKGFLSFPGGLGELIEALEGALTDGEAADRITIRTSTLVERLSQQLDGDWRVQLADGESLDADAVILATPSYVSAELLAHVDPTCAAAMRTIRWAGTATVNIAFRREDVAHPLDGSGWTTPRIEGRPVLACTWSSSKFQHRAPEGRALFRAFLGGDTNQTVMTRSDDELVALVRHELRVALGICADPVKVKLTRFAKGMPQYDLGHLDRVAFIEQRIAALRGLAIAGNSYRAVGIPDVIKSGEEAARRVMRAARPSDLALTT